MFSLHGRVKIINLPKFDDLRDNFSIIEEGKQPIDKDLLKVRVIVIPIKTI